MNLSFTQLILASEWRFLRQFVMIMANGLDRLEKLFSGTRRKEKAAQDTKPSESTQIFPSPAYLRPTSLHMMPRDPRGEGYERHAEDKGRSQSAPGPYRDDGRIPSEQTSPKRTDCLPVQNGSPSVVPSEVDLPYASSVAPRLSGFRFPEASLFFKEEIMRISGRLTPPATPLERSPHGDILKRVQSTDEKRPADYPLNHISALFKPPHINSESGRGIKDDAAESLRLLPSPIITGSGTVRLRRKQSASSGLTTPSPTAPPRGVAQPKISLFPKQRPYPPFQVPSIDSPPASDNGEDCPGLQIKPSMSTTSLPTPDSAVGPSLGSPSRFWTPDGEDQRNKRVAQETWGCRQGDPASGDRVFVSREGVLRSRLLQRSASAVSLSSVTSQIISERILREPMLGDFYSLSDDDIAEFQEPSPTLNALEAPGLPPKDDTKPANTSSPFRGLPVKATRPTPLVDSLTGEMTPTYTPIDSKFLTLECPLNGAAATQGAIWAARIAKKYHFDMIYVVSLWPIAAGHHWDPSRRPLADSPNIATFGPPSPGCAVVARPNLLMTGRLLAGYGLNEVVSPFQVGVDAHLKRLKSNEWEEYRDKAADIDELSQGWARSFYADYVPLPYSTTTRESQSKYRSPNRGIVFAGYSKRRHKSMMIPSHRSSERRVFLNRLLSDARTLVDALIKWT
ncbi:hypothetical protein DL763_004209 [Monosporascus cannonballus]|nr:hypothetical protein DL763_004209 [Monosporascus cannonballus]